MNSDFLLVHKSILPSFIPNVIQARDLIASQNLSVTQACKACSISRSTFYKYKDFVFVPTGSVSKKAIIAIKADDCPGVLSSILVCISASKANVLTIYQDLPIRGLAYITIMMNIRGLQISLDDLLKQIGVLSHVRKADIIAYE